MVRLGTVDFDPLPSSSSPFVRPRGFGHSLSECSGARLKTTYVFFMAITKTDLSLLLGLLGLLATLGLSPVLLLAAIASFLAGRCTR
jgi:hypothetical protein